MPTKPKKAKSPNIEQLNFLNEENDRQIVYALSNPHLPGITKIGKSTLNNIKNRLKALSGTSVPENFVIEYAGIVDNAAKVESSLHNLLQTCRINGKREFFKIGHDAVRVIMATINAIDVTAELKARQNGCAFNAAKDFSDEPAAEGTKGKNRSSSFIGFDLGDLDDGSLRGTVSVGSLPNDASAQSERQYIKGIPFLGKEFNSGVAQIGRRFKAKRREMKITQYEMAKITGVSRSSIEGFENGRADMISYDSVARLIYVFGFVLVVSER